MTNNSNKYGDGTFIPMGHVVLAALEWYGKAELDEMHLAEQRLSRGEIPNCLKG